MCIPWTCQILQEIYQELCQDGQAINTINSPEAKFEWTLIHHTAFLTLKESVTTNTYPMLSGSNKTIHSLH